MTASRFLLSTALSASIAAPAAAQESVTLDPIFIFGGARDLRALEDSPVSASVIDRDEIQTRQPESYEELLGDLPGVSIDGGPRGISQEPNIRGFTDDQIAIRVDGARQNFNLAHRGRFFVDPDALKRIEVIRGGASTLFGSGALGGAILLDTIDADDVLLPGQTWGGRAAFGFDTQGQALKTSATLAAQAGAFDVLGFVAYRPMFNDLTDGNGDDIANSQIDATSGLAKIGFTPGEGHRVELSWLGYHDEGDVPPNANAAASASNVVDRALDSQTARLAWQFAPSGSDLWDLNATAYWTDIKVDEDRYADGRLDRTRLTTLGFDISNVSRFEAGVPIALTYGIELYRDRREAERDGLARLQSPDATQTFGGLFAQADFELGHGVTVTPGLRFDWFETEPDDVYESRTDNQLSPRLAVSWRPTMSGQLYASAARSFRAPSTEELYADGVHFSIPGFPLGGPGSPVFTGNNVFTPSPDLEPEDSLQFEIGGRWRFDDLIAQGDAVRVSAAVYYARVDNYVNQVVNFMDFSTLRYDAASGQLLVDGTTTSGNVDAELWGFEAELGYDAARWFAAAGLSIPRGQQRDGGALGTIPQDKLTVSGGFRPVPDMTVGARATFRDGSDGAGISAGGSGVVDVYATWAPTEGALRNAAFMVGVDNVFDKTYRIYPNGLNQTGIAFKAAAALQF